jgi:hypothetical protein
MDNLIIQKQLEEYCIKFYATTDQQERQTLDKTLTEFVKYENYETLKSLIGCSNNPYVRFYAANSLILLFTQNYLTIPAMEAYKVYEELLEYLVTILITF